MSTQYTIKATNASSQVVAVFKAIDFADAHYDSTTTTVKVRFNTVLQSATSLQTVSEVSITTAGSSDAAAILSSIYTQLEAFYSQTSLIP
jgi:hypothetical protein